MFCISWEQVDQVEINCNDGKLIYLSSEVHSRLSYNDQVIDNLAFIKCKDVRKDSYQQGMKSINKAKLSKIWTLGSNLGWIKK